MIKGRREKKLAVEEKFQSLELKQFDRSNRNLHRDTSNQVQ